MIAVDTKVLAKAIGLEKWPEEFYNDHQRMAARCVTDFVGPDETRRSEHRSAGDALYNATVWITVAYDAGLAAGMELERKRWHQKLAKLFGIPIER